MGGESPTKGGIQVGVARAHSGMIQTYDLICPNCIATFKDHPSINRNIRNNICRYEMPDWGEIWEDTYAKIMKDNRAKQPIKTT